MLKITALSFVLLSTAFLASAQQTAADTKAVATPFVLGETVEIQSSALAEKRVLNIYLPEGYQQETDVSYPVIYLLDGSANEDFIHIVGLVQFFRMQFNMPKTIVVGIANVDRKRDFTFPTTDAEQKKAYPTTGGSARFIDFLEQEVQPFIQKKYRVTGAKTIIGQSLGALLATEILLKKPELFDRYCIVSPSLWWDNESLLKQAPTLLGKERRNPGHVYVSVGTEGKVMERDAKDLAKLLLKSGIKVDFVPLPKEDHGSILHNSVYAAFQLFYPVK